MRFFKKITKWAAGFFSLVGFVSFLAGFYTLALVDLFYFHKEISPPTYSAAFAGGALMLACYTAIKVNKWLNNKINETAYKQAEYSMELLRTLIVHLFHISHCFRRLRIANEKNGEYTRILEDLKPRYKNYIDTINELTVVIESLPSWKIEFAQKNIITQAAILIKESNFNSIVLTSIALLGDDKIKQDKKAFFSKNSKTVIMIYDTLEYRFHSLLKMPYSNKFKHLSHHP